MFAAIRRASSLLSNVAAERLLEIDIGRLLPAGVAHDKAGVQFLDGPGRRETAGGVQDFPGRDLKRRAAPVDMGQCGVLTEVHNY